MASKETLATRGRLTSEKELIQSAPSVPIVAFRLWSRLSTEQMNHVCVNSIIEESFESASDDILVFESIIDGK